MPATYTLTVGGTIRTMRPGWSLRQTANGRDVLTFSIGSRTGTFRPPLDAVVTLDEAVAIQSSAAGASAVITTREPHGLYSGQDVQIAGHTGSTPVVPDGAYVATRLTATTFSIPFTLSAGGTGGVAARRLFAGTIQKPTERGANGRGVVPIVTAVDTADYGQQAERRHYNGIISAATLKVQAQALCTALGWTLHPSQVDGPACAEVNADYALARDLLDKWTTATGYTWSFDPYNRLRFVDPGTFACPFNIAAGDGHVVGDMTVAPSRDRYANRVIVRFSGIGLQAYAFLGFSGTSNFANADEVEIAGRTYTFQTTLTNENGHVRLGATQTESLEHLAAAVTLGAGAGTDYATAMTVNAAAEAYLHTPTVLKARAKSVGVAGNNLDATTTASAAFWYWEGTIPTATFLGGADAAMNHVAQADDLAEQGDHGIWDEVVEARDIVVAADAQALADAILPTRVVVPKVVTYRTTALGALPSLTQTIVQPSRDLNGTFLITDVATVRTSGIRVLREITAIQSLLLQSTSRWQDMYKKWSGSASGSGTAVAGGVTIVSLTTTLGAVYWLGGSDREWVGQITGPAWQALNGVQARIDATLRGSTSATCYVRARVKSGTLQVRVKEALTDTVVGTIAAPVSATSLTLASFAVTLAAGVGLYYLEVLPSAVRPVEGQVASAFIE